MENDEQLRHYGAIVKIALPTVYSLSARAIQLNAIAESLAILRADRELTQGDIDTVARLSKWINYDFKEL